MKQQINQLADYEPEWDRSMSRLLHAPELKRFSTYSAPEQREIINTAYNDWVAHSQSEFDDIFSEGHSTIKIEADGMYGQTILRPIDHSPSIYEGKIEQNFVEEVESLAEDEDKIVYFEDNLMNNIEFPELNAEHLDDHDWASSQLGLDKDQFYEWCKNGFDSRRATGRLKTSDGSVITQGELIGYKHGQNAPIDANKRTALGVWFTSYPEPIQAKLDKELISRETGIIQSGRSIEMAREIERINLNEPDKEVNVYMGAGHAPGVYQYLQGSDIKREVYEILDLEDF